eukprot:SM000094S24740  [mRNA]  locus=s94:486352:491818:- [translate_table: standard]
MDVSGPIGADAHLVAAELPAEVLDLDARLAVDFDVEARLAAGATGSRVNSFFKTFDGIDVMGSRLASEIQEVVHKFESLEKISIVAHSLGGLIARYAIAKLHTPQHGDAAHSSARGEGPQENELVHVDQAGSSAERARRRGHDDQDRDRAAAVAEPGTKLDNGPAPSPNASVEAHTDALRTETKSDDAREEETPDDAWRSAADDGKELKEVAPAEAAARGDPRTMSKRHSNGVIAGLKPINFVTIATPHLGCRGKGQLPFLFRIGWLEKLAPALAHIFTGRTGCHLFLTDGDPPLLMRMATNCEEGQFIATLASFQQRTCYANTKYDPSIRTESTRLEACAPCPLQQPRFSNATALPAQPISPQYKHVMKIEESPGTDSDKSTGAASRKGSAYLHGDTQQGEHTNSELEGPPQVVPMESDVVTAHSDAMAAALERVPWRRVDVSFQGAKMVWMAHNQIQVKTHWLHWEGEGVIAHVIDNLIL